MTIDERLESLRQSTERLFQSVEELSVQQQIWIERQKAQEAKEARLRRTMLQGIRAFREGLNGDGEQE
jgi:hypothetical protein